MHFNILVFPCGSEIGLEIYRSLRYSRHITLFGANSIDDHGKFVYENYIPNLPFYNENNFIEILNSVIKKHKIDAIYPAMDSIITFLKENEHLLECKVIAPKTETTQLCLSKSKTYKFLNNIISTPKIYESIEHIDQYPVFIKPDIGYGSRGVCKAYSKDEVKLHLEKYPDSIISEFLPGKEYTVDCFTNQEGQLIFCGARERKRLSNGISVNTIRSHSKQSEIEDLTKKINSKISFSGAWFAQFKENSDGKLVLLEIAARLGGSSSLHRNIGVNFALLSILNTFNIDVEIFTNDYDIELDRALDNRYKIKIDYNTVYCDFDDCLIVNDKVNLQLLSFLYQCINEKKHLILITKHNKNIHETLKKKKLSNIFDDIIHLTIQDKKYQYIKHKKSIFIDDSYAERKEVHDNLKIYTFAPDNIECLLK